ncbi:MAG: ABC transporter ATP-binding protein [Candidatus Bipolaricaulaceae bacterium]
MPEENSIVLSVQDLSKSYGQVRAVDGVSFSVPGGSIFTLLGPNGAGKTTTLEILEGLRAPDAGQIELFGSKVRRVTGRMKQRMGVLLQEGGFEPYLRVREVLGVFAALFDRSIPIDEVLARVGLEDKARAQVRSLSSGQKQRLALGAALINDPDLLFLDEPTTGLDPQARRHMWDSIDALKAQGKTMVLTTHYMEEAEALADQVCIMDHGKVIARGSPRELVAGLGEETMVEFAAPELPPAARQALAGCAPAVRSDGQLVILEADDLVATMERLLSWSRAQGIPLADMTVRQPNLEDVFLSLTGRRLRE